jgi:aryl-alcohol dehydrogenase-like predicted oxidoreductase
MVTRREWLGLTLGTGAALTLNPRWLAGMQQQSMIMRAIPSSGEQLPIVGLGSSATFSQVARSQDVDALREVLETLVARGGKVFDTAPSYGASEEVAGRLAADLGITDKIFWATKVNVAGRGGSSADPAAARAQIQSSFDKLRKPKIDLIQVHNLGDIPTQLGILKEMKQQGKIRYIGVTSTSDGQYDELANVMRNEPLDFIGIDYAVDNRNCEETILPLAIQRKIGVLVYVPFGRTSLFRRVGDRPVPDWAHEFDAHSWAQFFIKYAASHPAVTTVTPATSNAEHMIDNLGGGMGRLPNDAQRKRMIEFVDALPAAPGRGRGGLD